jgi:transposase-like protein
MGHKNIAHKPKMKESSRESMDYDTPISRNFIREELYRMYIRDRKPVRQIGRELKMDSEEILRQLTNYGVHVLERVCEDLSHLSRTLSYYQTLTKVERLYLEDQKSIRDIARETGLRQKYISAYLRSRDILKNKVA